MESESIIFELIIIFSGVAVLSTLFLFMKQPIIIAYIVLGMIIGPFGIRILDNAQHIEHISHFGIILLMFLIGLNLHPHKLISLFRKTALITFLTCLIFFALFGLVAFAFGFGVRDSIVIGVALMFSSTIVGLKLIPTTTLHQKHLGEVMISILLLQDIIAILVIILLGGSSNSNLYFHIPMLILKGSGLVLLSFFFFRYCILWLFKRFDTIQEYLLVVTLGWCLAIAGISESIGLSYEIGAFIAGCSFAQSPVSLIISEKLKSLREFFLILFFFAIGTQVDISLLSHVLLPSIVIGVLVIVTKPLIFATAFKMSHENSDKAKELGCRLGQSSEFSLLVTYVATASAIITTNASYLIQLTTIITWIVSTYIVSYKYETPIASKKALRKD